MLQNKQPVIEALHRANFRLRGRQKIHIFKEWGVTKFNVDESENMRAEKQLTQDGCGVKYIPNCGPHTNGGMRAFSSLLTPTNKSYLPVQKKNLAGVSRIKMISSILSKS